MFHATGLKCFVAAGVIACAAVAIASNPGDLLHTFTGSLGSGEGFGASVAETPSRIIIGAPQLPSSGPTGPGQVYVFDKTDPYDQKNRIPGITAGDGFGQSVSGMGSDILVGAPSAGGTIGAAYLFNGPDGQPLKFPIPNPHLVTGAYFGNPVVQMGNNILVAAPRDDPGGAPACGAVYLIDGTSGTTEVLHTFQPPTIGSNKDYGFSVTVVGNNMVLIGAQRDGPGDSGIAYVYEHTGTDWTTNWSNKWTIPSPGGGNYFGRSVASLGNKGLICDYNNKTYVYDLSDGSPPNPPPLLHAFNVGGLVAAVGNNILTAQESSSTADLYDGTNYTLLLHVSIPNANIVSISGADNNILIGDPSVNNEAGAVYLVQGVPVPEPSTLVLLGVGAISLLAYAWRRRKRA